MNNNYKINPKYYLTFKNNMRKTFETFQEYSLDFSIITTESSD